MIEATSCDSATRRKPIKTKELDPQNLGQKEDWIGYSYSVQRSTNLLDWVTVWTTNAPAGGLFNFTDNFGDLGGNPGSAYYRLSWAP